MLLGLLSLLANNGIWSQTLNKPELRFSSACDDGTTSDFEVSFSYTTTSFNDDNVFTIELSDADGNWGNPVNVGTVTTENSSFSFSRTFQLPDNTFGQNYKIRLVASSPAMTSPDSDPFQAYKIINGPLILNDYNNVVLCEGETAEVTLNTEQEGEYQWFKDGALLTTTTEPKLQVSVSGTYQVKVDYKACGFKNSTLIDVTVFNNADAQIKGPVTVEICGNEAHTFEANTTNNAYIYNWYLDGTLVQSSNESTYTTPTAGQFGTYRLEIDTGNCVTTSSNVILQQENAAEFTVTTSGPLTSVVLPRETKELCISHNASSATVQWYRDNTSMGSAANQLCINARVAGEYFARVTQSSDTSCDVVVDSDKYTLVEAKSFNTVIRTETDYEACNSSNTKLSIVGVKAVGSDGNEYDLSASQIDMLTYQWNKNGNPISGETSNELSLGSYEDSGLYTLTVSVALVNGESNELDIKLTEIPEVSSSSASNALCDGGSITFTIQNKISGYTYQWIKDGTEDVTPSDPQTLVVTEKGEYVLKYTGYGCENELAPIVVKPFDDSAVTITPSEKLILEEGNTEVIVASGGESYEWYEGEDTTGTLLSTTEELRVSSLGFYTVLVKVGECSVEKTIEVVAPDDQVIVPNTLTPNGDGSNDTWKISNKYAFQPSVTIMLYNANGKEIYKTTEYRNDWPTENLGNQKVFYYKIIRDSKLIKAGTISVLH